MPFSRLPIDRNRLNAETTASTAPVHTLRKYAMAAFHMPASKLTSEANTPNISITVATAAAQASRKYATTDPMTADHAALNDSITPAHAVRTYSALAPIAPVIIVAIDENAAENAPDTASTTPIHTEPKPCAADAHALLTESATAAHVAPMVASAGADSVTPAHTAAMVSATAPAATVHVCLNDPAAESQMPASMGEIEANAPKAATAALMASTHVDPKYPVDAVHTPASTEPTEAKASNDRTATSTAPAHAEANDPATADHAVPNEIASSDPMACATAVTAPAHAALNASDLHQTPRGEFQSAIGNVHRNFKTKTQICKCRFAPFHDDLQSL